VREGDGTVASPREYDFDMRAERTPRPVPAQNPDQPPVILAANIVTKNDKGEDLPRNVSFPGAGKRTMIDDRIVTKDPVTGTAMLPVGVHVSHRQ